MFYIVRKEFDGSILSYGRVLDAVKLCIEEIQKHETSDLRIVESAEVERLIKEHDKTYHTDPKEITQERWQDSLEVLPPCRWSRHNGVEYFHLSERYTGDVVYWFARLGDRYFEFRNDCGLLGEQVAAIVHNWVDTHQ